MLSLAMISYMQCFYRESRQEPRPRPQHVTPFSAGLSWVHFYQPLIDESSTISCHQSLHLSRRLMMTTPITSFHASGKLRKSSRIFKFSLQRRKQWKPTSITLTFTFLLNAGTQLLCQDSWTPLHSETADLKLYRGIERMRNPSFDRAPGRHSRQSSKNILTWDMLALYLTTSSTLVQKHITFPCTLWRRRAAPAPSCASSSTQARSLPPALH